MIHVERLRNRADTAGLWCPWRRVRRYRLLDRLAAPAGAEWSLFCPAIGMAADSSARVIALLPRTAGVAGGLATPAVENTVVAEGTEVCVPDGTAGKPSLPTDSTIGFGGRSFWHAISKIALKQQAASVVGDCIGVNLSSFSG